MNPAVERLLIEASSGIPIAIGLLAQRFNIQIPIQLMEKLPEVGERIPQFVHEYRKAESPLSGTDKQVADLILNLSGEDVKSILSTLFSEVELSGKARLVIDGFLATIKLQRSKDG